MKPEKKTAHKAVQEAVEAVVEEAALEVQAAVAAAAAAVLVIKAGIAVAAEIAKKEVHVIDTPDRFLSVNSHIY